MKKYVSVNWSIAHTPFVSSLVFSLFRRRSFFLLPKTTTNRIVLVPVLIEGWRRAGWCSSISSIYDSDAGTADKPWWNDRKKRKYRQDVQKECFFFTTSTSLGLFFLNKVSFV